MKYVLGILGFLILTVIAVALLASTTSNRTDKDLEGKRIVQLTDYIDSGTVTYTAQGKINGEEEHKSIRITVSPSERRVQILSGYNARVEREQASPNNAAAFDAFMHSLAQSGYSLERDVANKDMRGVCPLGKRYIYSLRAGGDQVVDLWSTSCSSKEGTFGGDDSLVRRLFQEQIPDYNKFVSGVRL